MFCFPPCPKDNFWNGPTKNLCLQILVAITAAINIKPYERLLLSLISYYHLSSKEQQYCTPSDDTLLQRDGLPGMASGF